jgi:hypothetical protein
MKFVPLYIVIIFSEYFVYQFSLIETTLTESFVKGFIIILIQLFLLAMSVNMTKSD